MIDCFQALLSSFAFTFNLRRYMMAKLHPELRVHVR